MAKRLILFQVIILAAALMIVLAGCDKDEYPPSLYDPDYVSKGAAVISSVNPSALALSGVTEIVINGTNFSPVKENNLVFFNAEKGTVLEATESMLKVRAPIYASDSVALRIAVQGAVLFSNIWPYKLEPAQEPLVKFTTAEVPYAVATDAEGNVYTSMVLSNAGAGVKKIAAGSDKFVDFAPKGGETYYSAMKIGPGNTLYGVRNVKGIFTYKAGDAKPAVFASSGLGNIIDIDFDANKNVWGVGNNTDVYRVKPDKSVAKFAFKANLRAVRVYNNYLYVAGDIDKVVKVWRFPINGDELGAVEEVFNFTDKVGANFAIYCITFSADGYMYIGTDAPAAIYLLTPGGALEALYPGQFVPKVISFAWGLGTDLFMTREVTIEAEKVKYQQLIFRINTQKEGAPQFGIL
ncbi:MAG TPA: IPT/TIG domain-containing protein [bacterium]|nr:IPT/TIG domain-containing protein [bacterium]HOH06971.1 IPT/TIG domain-containing protein [bacterium]